MKRLTNREVKKFRYSMKQMRIRMMVVTKRRCRILKREEVIDVDTVDYPDWRRVYRNTFSMINN